MTENLTLNYVIGLALVFIMGEGLLIYYHMDGGALDFYFRACCLAHLVFRVIEGLQNVTARKVVEELKRQGLVGRHCDHP